MKKTPTLYVLIGCPASGKSTFAEWLVKSEPKTMRVSRDEIRFAQFQNQLEPEAEGMISKMVTEQTRSLLLNGWNVVLDNCHTKKEYLNQVIQTYQNLGNIEFKIFDLPLEELQARNQKRTRVVPPKVIETMYGQMQKLIAEFDFSPLKKVKENLSYCAQNKELPKALICDLDGTLCLMNGRNPFDASSCDADLLNQPVGNLLKNYHQLGYKILLVSGREDKYEAPTLRFLEKHALPFDLLRMRKARDNRKDALVKTEIYNLYIKDQFFVEFVLDDRNQVVDLWRKELQLPCFQVNYGDF